MRVVVSAYACAPGSGSEAYVGHNWVKQIARFHEVLVLTDGRNRGAIARHDYGRNVRFEFIDCLSETVKAGRDFRDWRGREWWGYYQFLVKSYSRARRLLKDPGFDLCHLVTFASFRWPFFLALLPRPSIFGPVGGGELYPPGFRRSPYEHARTAFTRLTRVDPLLRATLRRTSLILAGNRATVEAFSGALGWKIRVMQTGIDIREFARRAPRKPGGTFVILWVGLLIKRKALDLLVAALPAVQRELGDSLRVVVCGDGPDRTYVEARARELGVASCVEWRGWTSRQDVLRAYEEADVFCFTSLRDTFAVAVLEAMASGLPVVCLAHAGPGEMVTDESGLRVTATTREHVVRDLAAALLSLARNRKMRETLGAGARRRAEEVYDWNVLGEQMRGLYEEIVQCGR